MIQPKTLRVLVPTRTNGQLLKKTRTILRSWNMLDRTKISMQVTIVHWIALLFSSAASNAILLVMLWDRWTFEPVFVVAFFATSSMIPLLLSIVGTIHLSGIGEKRVLGTTGINLLTIPMVILLECAQHGQYLWTFISNSVYLSLYLIFLGYLEPLATRPILGVSGGQSQCKKELIVLDASFSNMKTLLSSPKVS